jgi:hypothetical protein
MRLIRWIINPGKLGKAGRQSAERRSPLPAVPNMTHALEALAASFNG